MRNKSLLAALTFLAGFAVTPAAWAASSAWFSTDGARLRLIAMPSADGKTLDAGLQIELEKGWKTYWRSPGSSGLPPQLSFAGSRNVASTTLHFPVPTSFSDGASDSLTSGYTSSTTFPLTVEPLFANRTVALNVQGLIGICAEICVPMQFALSVGTNANGFSARDEATALLNARASLPSQPQDNFRIADAVFDGDGKKALRVVATVPDNTAQATLFVEGPSDWYLSPARATSIDGRTAIFDIALDDLPDDAVVDGKELTFTLNADGKGIEQKLTARRR